MNDTGNDTANDSQLSRLTRDLLRRIASHLHPNEVVASLKLVNRETAACLRDYSRLQLSRARAHRRTTLTTAQDPWPGHAFVAYWGRPEPWQRQTLPQRRRLLALAASSCHAASLDVALRHCRVPVPACVEVLEAAAAAGDVAACERLLAPELGARDYIVEFAMAAAAQEGQLGVLECIRARGFVASSTCLGTAARAACYAGRAEALAWLAERYPSGAYEDGHACWELAIAAAEGGHPELAQQLLARRTAASAALTAADNKQRLRRLLCGLAFGCLLPAFEPFRRYIPAAGSAAGGGSGGGWGWVLDSVTAAGAVLSAMMGSMTSDWERKLIWLQEQCVEAAPASVAGAPVPLAALLFGGAAGGASVYMDWAVAASRADFATRLRALHAAGFGFPGNAAEEVAEAAVRWGDMAALDFALDTLGGRVTARVERAAVCGGDLAVLKFMRQRGARFAPQDVVTAAGYQRWAAARWLADAAAEDAQYGGDDEEDEAWSGAFAHVARAGAPLALLRHLHEELGAAVDLAAVAGGGSREAELWAAQSLGVEPSQEEGGSLATSVGCVWV
ncbi:hypothetical protein HYH02_003600 [Chlamydomonas schloesseri]|uniref:F-box domain-containing protein n=1 Tax=Chlamydomonas schloesseri TaxID=2026947 RepID=A0A836BA66_9CHLO|nr:hypothetical protein HYH02_003600 [Chlamydomonas schloesseri]|eukprot:KAG2451824.1 hypothetical protein HYH02_003600 [Chlamydomonas schloesseri]